MDIGPVRRRFTAEPISSPVPAEEPHGDAPALERVAHEQTTTYETAATTRA